MIRALLLLPLVWMLEWFSRMDEEELFERSADGSATARWAVEVRMQIDRRQVHIDRMRADLPRLQFAPRGAR